MLYGYGQPAPQSGIGTLGAVVALVAIVGISGGLLAWAVDMAAEGLGALDAPPPRRYRGRGRPRRLRRGRRN